MAGPLCEVKNVSQEFTLPDGKRFTALENVSLAIQPNEVVALLGPSGCGKSTILRILAGLIKPTKGEVLAHGAPLVDLNPSVAMVFQSFALYPWMTVTRNVEAVLEAAGLPREQVEARAARAIRLVGLAGFEGAYPRELSGGMKQRVGMARALAMDPELLFMDEPFSQVDALTAESMRAEIIDIWMAKDRNPSTIVMVSHDIKEVVYMADRIVVLGANPGRVRTIVENKLPRPRDYNSAEVLALVDRLHDIITGTLLPDAPAAEEPGADVYEPLPDTGPSAVAGLLEYLDARGGKGDVFRIAADTNQEFGHVITVVKAAEMLDFVDTPRRAVLLDREGRRFVKASPEQRKVVWRDGLMKLRLFREVRRALESSETLRLSSARVKAMIAAALPHENVEKTFQTFVAWARFADLLAYDEIAQALSLDEEDDGGAVAVATGPRPGAPKLADFVGPESVELGLSGTDAASVLLELSHLLAAHSGGKLDAGTVAERMLAREHECGTALGRGVAVPHARAPEIDRPLLVLGRHPTGVRFDAADGEPCRLFFALVAPTDQPNIHLKLMARIARLVRDEPIRRRLLDAPDVASLLAVLREADISETGALPAAPP